MNLNNLNYGDDNLFSKSLEILNKKYNQKINVYYGKKTKLVFGYGDIKAKIALIGEAPGKNEVIEGKPFVGKAGKNLDEFLNILNIKKENIYITNIVKIRPTKINSLTGREINRPPTKDEVSLFTELIKEELKIIKPELVVTLGNVALKCITDDNSLSIGVMHGKIKKVKFGEENYDIFPLYHPASIIYRQELKKTYIEDLYTLKKHILKS